MPLHPPILEPVASSRTLQARPWGGHRLALLRGGADARIGESWEFSTLAGHGSDTTVGPLEKVLGRPLPFLAKLIDTAAPLSVQVHPGDDPETGMGGKEEAWIILDADTNATLSVGLRPGVSKQQFVAGLEDARRGQGAQLLAQLQPISAEPGAIVLVPAGTVHAIGSGILLAEIQQPSDCTYRLFDYGRDRALHHDEASVATAVDARPIVWRPGDSPTTIRGCHLDLLTLGAGTHELAHHGHDTLLVAVGGSCRLETSEGAEVIGPTDLRLWTHGDLRARVSESASLVVASLPR